MDPITVAQIGLFAKRHWKLIAILAAITIAVPITAIALIVTTVAGNSDINSSQTVADFCISAASTQPAFGQWPAAAITNAATIMGVGENMSVPEFGVEIAIATAMQESSLENLDHGDQDSLGLFQQRPSQGWGTAAQIMDPVHASGQFYDHLLKVANWQDMTLDQDAQAVQRSGNPGAYAKWQQPAAQVIAHLEGGTVTLTAATSSCAPGQIPAGTPADLRKVLAYAYAALGTAYDFGGSCTDPQSGNMALHCDCSSLVQQSFLKAGLQLPRTAADQDSWAADGHGQLIPASQAQLGDVIYSTSDLGSTEIGHTGIIIDPKKMIMLDAPHTGADVRLESYQWMLQEPVHHIYRLINISTPAGTD